ncbi:MAG: serine/threonine-protein phosphatase [Burkholderiales bacterium]|nr:serine/threonine-protein phosphatase [Burkholderiales bacterium]
MSHHELEVASCTDTGKVRPYNDDSVAVDAAAGIAAIADGMALRRGADVASRIATAELLERLRRESGTSPERAVREAFSAIDRAIHEQAQKNVSMQGMATTLVAAWFRGERVSIAHVGDSRLYRFRDGQLERLTIDHSFVQEQLSAGTLTNSEARLSQSRHLVTRALGTSEGVAPDLSEHEVRPGDIYLLCSDGLHDLVDDSDIALALETLQPNIGLAAATLVHMANDRGGLDNISVVIVRVKNGRSKTQAASARDRQSAHPGLFGWLGRILGK